MTFRQESLSCPLCAQALVHARLDDRPIQGCGACGGVWMDRADLAAVLHRRLGREVELVEFNDGAPRHACPSCRACMNQLWFELLALEACQTHGVWIDRPALTRALVGDVMPAIQHARPTQKNPNADAAAALTLLAIADWSAPED